MKTYFISGHRDATREEFEKHYVPILKELIKSPNRFKVGDCPGADSYAIDYLRDNNIENVTVYHIGSEPMYNRGFNLVGGFTSDFYRDYTMTLYSDVDVCWVRKLRSGTQLNIDRRKWMNERKLKGMSYSYEDLINIEANYFL